MIYFNIQQSKSRLKPKLRGKIVLTSDS